MLAERPVGFIFGVGPASQEKLIQRGFRLIGDLQRADEHELMKQLGGEGQRLWRLARGIDDRRVVADRGAKTISNETTFENDIRDLVTLEKLLWKLSEKVSARLKSSGLVGSTMAAAVGSGPNISASTRAKYEAAATSGGWFSAASASGSHRSSRNRAV